MSETVKVIFQDGTTRTCRIRRINSNPGVKGLDASVRRFKEFNRKSPKKLVRKTVDLSVPFVRIGEVPIVTYMSDKEGKTKGYQHETDKRPVLYMHPSKPIGVLIGGSIKVRDWLYD